MNRAPFYENEYRIMEAFLSGDSKELAALRNQLDSLRYQSPLYKAGRFLGLPYRASGLKRSSKTLRFKVGWGIGAEDWRLGDRRAIVLNDVFVRLEDGCHLCSELRIADGLLQELRILGVLSQGAPHLHAFGGSWRSIRMDECYFASACKNDRDLTQRRLSKQRDPRAIEVLHPPAEFANPSSFQKWVLSLDTLAISPTGSLKDELGLTLPLHLRRARPASANELNLFKARCERNHGVTVPAELTEFWALTNGASFFGDPISGTYDAHIFKCPGGWRALVLTNMFDQNHYFSVELPPVDSGGSYYTNVHEEILYGRESVRSWASLQAALRFILLEVQRGGRSPDRLEASRCK